jgi:hypothetical protein
MKIVPPAHKLVPPHALIFTKAPALPFVLDKKPVAVIGGDGEKGIWHASLDAFRFHSPSCADVSLAPVWDCKKVAELWEFGFHHFDPLKD